MMSCNRTRNAVTVIIITFVICVIAVVIIVPYDHLQQAKHDHVQETDRQHAQCKQPNPANCQTRLHRPTIDPDPLTQSSENAEQDFSSPNEELPSDTEERMHPFSSEDEQKDVVENTFVVTSIDKSLNHAHSAHSISIPGADSIADHDRNENDDDANHIAVKGVAGVYYHDDGDDDDENNGDDNHHISNANGDSTAVDVEDTDDQRDLNHLDPDEDAISPSHQSMQSSSASVAFPGLASVIIPTTASSVSSSYRSVYKVEQRDMSPDDFSVLSSNRMLHLTIEQLADVVIQSCKSSLKTFYRSGRLQPQDDLYQKWDSLESLAPFKLQIRVSAYLAKVQELNFILVFRRICRNYERMENASPESAMSYMQGIHDFRICMAKYENWQLELSPQVKRYTDRIAVRDVVDYLQMAREYVERQIEKSIHSSSGPL